MRDIIDLQRRLRNSKQRSRRKPDRVKKFVHLFCGQSFGTLDEALAHDKEGGCVPSRATARCFLAKGIRFGYQGERHDSNQ
jgi:hypothetical protein